MPLTDEQKKNQTHTLNPHAFNASPEVVKRVKENPLPKEKQPSLEEIWNGMSRTQREEALNNMPSDQQLMLFDALHKGRADLSVSATPSLLTLAWIKQKAADLSLKLASYLPTAGGMAGGAGASAITSDTVGPEAAATAKVVGSGIGGGLGEIGRQGIEHFWGADDPDYTWKQRATDVGKEAAGQGAAELFAGQIAKAMRPTFSKSIDKIVSIGGLSGSSKLGGAETKNLETVMQDLIDTEKMGNKVVTIGDFSDLLETTKREVGNQVDLAMQQPVNFNGKMVPLRYAEANVLPISDRIKQLLTAHPSEAAGAVGENLTKLANIRKRALQYAKPRKFGELTDRRILLNNEISGFYNLPADEQQAYLLSHPNFEIDKAEADAIRDVIYPEMDRASGHSIGTTKALQGRRGALISLSKAFDKRVGIPAQVHAKSREIGGTPFWKRGNFSTYGTTSGKPGMAVHRLGSLIVKPDPEGEASSQVARAFGNKTSSKIAKAITTPFGHPQLGTEMMSMPLRLLMKPDAKTPPQPSTPPSSTEAPQTMGGQSRNQTHTHVWNPETQTIEAV